MLHPLMKHASKHKNASILLGKILRALRVLDSEQLFLHIINECNLSCIYCYRKGHKGNIKTDRILELIKESKQLKIKIIGLSGGETLLHKNLYKIIKTCYKNKQHISIYTNAILLDDVWVRRLKPLRKRIEIIFKADSPVTYKNHTGKDAFAKVEKNINRCISSGIRVTALITATRLNVNYVSDIIRRYLETGAQIRIMQYIPMGTKIDKKLELSPEEFRSVFNGFYNEFARYYRKTPSTLFNEMKNIALMTNPTFCFCYNRVLSIDTNGDVTHCPMSNSGYNTGNINNESLETVLKRIKKQRPLINKIPDECKSCEYSRYCRGGCRLYALHKKRPFNKRNPTCLDKNMFFLSPTLQIYYSLLNRHRP